MGCWNRLGKGKIRDYGHTQEEVIINEHCFGNSMSKCDQN